MSNLAPAEVFHPGEFLRDELDARGWTQTEFAEIIGRSVRLVNEIIAGKRGITPETANAIGAALGTSAQFWMNLESSYQLSKAGPAPKRIAQEAKLREQFPVREMVRRGWIEPSEDFDVLEARVLSFFGITSIEEKPQFAYAARRRSFETPSPAQLAWLFRVRQLAQVLHVGRYSERALREALPRLRELMTEPEEARYVPKLLADLGVRFVIVEPFPGSKIDGVCSWVDGDTSPAVGMSLRLDRIDNFWFVLRHELEHVLRGDGREEIYLDELDGEASGTSEDLPEAERAANAAAAEFCVPARDMEDFIARLHPMYPEQRVIGFARLMKVHPGIVVGQLQRKIGRWDLFRKHLPKMRDILVQGALTDGYGQTGPLTL